MLPEAASAREDLVLHGTDQFIGVVVHGRTAGAADHQGATGCGEVREALQAGNQIGEAGWTVATVATRSKCASGKS